LYSKQIKQIKPIEEALKKVGLKVTVPRLRILEQLHESIHTDKHCSAEKIYQKLSSKKTAIGLGTIYRVLSQFEAAGLVVRHHFEEDPSVFELATEEHHDHLVCTNCGKVVEFMDAMIESRQETIAESHQFTMTNHNLILYGICGACQNEK
jgi:Fur family transcriptional regulator, ferric uptake regulator